MFNPYQFLETTVNESNDTVVVPVPQGEYTAVLTEVKCRSWQKKDDPSVAGLALDIQWDIDSPEVKALLGRDKVTCKQGVMLDLTESGGLDMGKGKNVGLGRLREACNLNVAGVPFSFTQLTGRVAKVKVEHRINGEQIFAEVKQVAKM
jgi:hypothetical protein